MAENGHNTTISLDEIGHPKGTLAILAIYMLLFMLGWAGLYFYQFLPRGTPDSQVGDGQEISAPAEPGVGPIAPVDNTPSEPSPAAAETGEEP